MVITTHFKIFQETPGPSISMPISHLYGIEQFPRELRDLETKFVRLPLKINLNY